MPRTKGSKNKATLLSVDERIAAVSAEIEALQKQVKGKKAELKKLNAEKGKENQKQILAAAAASGKTAEEIIKLIQGEDVPAAE